MDLTRFCETHLTRTRLAIAPEYVHFVFDPCGLNVTQRVWSYLVFVQQECAQNGPIVEYLSMPCDAAVKSIRDDRSAGRTK